MQIGDCGHEQEPYNRFRRDAYIATTPREHDCERIQDPVKRTLCKAQGPPPLDCNNVKDPILKGICRTKGLDGGESSSSTEL